LIAISLLFISLLAVQQLALCHSTIAHQKIAQFSSLSTFFVYLTLVPSACVAIDFFEAKNKDNHLDFTVLLEKSFKLPISQQG